MCGRCNAEFFYTRQWDDWCVVAERLLSSPSACMEIVQGGGRVKARLWR
jgi:hypothetical protein